MFYMKLRTMLNLIANDKRTAHRIPKPKPPEGGLGLANRLAIL